MRSPRFAYLATTVTTLVLLVGCVSQYVTSNSNKTNRSLASDDSANVSQVVQNAVAEDAQVRGGHPHFPQGLGPHEAADFWHLSEGSDIFPMKWFALMQDQMNILSQNTRLNEKLDQKFGVLVDPLPSNYPNRWIGITAAWSGLSAHQNITPDNSDVHLTSTQSFDEIATKVQNLSNGDRSVAMMGVNCTFCHTNAVQMQPSGKVRIIDGAPNLVLIRGFFHDLFGSAVLTMLDEKALSAFLDSSGVVGDNKAYAHQFAADFARQLELPNTPIDQIRTWIGKTFLPHKKFVAEGEPIMQPYLFNHQEVVKTFLTKLFKVSYGLRDGEHLSKELDMRMDWLAKSIGFDPRIPSSVDGYARTDAFGRISNMVARGNYPNPLTATVSVPMVWSTQYRDMFHYNGNTNSVAMRNIGQSFGLGSIEVDAETHDSTVNMSNLHKIESLLYKIPVPNGSQYFSEIDINKAVAGCNTFYKTCAGCHEASAQRVGPTQELINYKLIPVATLAKNDPKVMASYGFYNYIQASPVKSMQNGQLMNIPFRDALFGFTGKIRQRYYTANNVSEEAQKDWEHLDLRGAEVFRDTYLAKTTDPNSSDSPYMNSISTAQVGQYGYVARNLAGVWATGPFLHNGSVPTVYDLLLPANRRPSLFFVGSRLLDNQKLGFQSDRWILRNGQVLKPTMENCRKFPDACFDVADVGNDNHGHEFGNALTDSQRYELIEFLKIMRPEVEYSWNQLPLYKVVRSGAGGGVSSGASANEFVCTRADAGQ